MSMTLEPRDLREALRSGNLSLAYQAQWDIADRARFSDARPVSVEALSRWHHEDAGDVSPGAFVPLAEQGRFLDALDVDVLQRATRQVAAWRADGHELGLSVNAAPSHFSTAYADAALRAVDQVGLDPRALTIEITETPSPQFSEAMRVGLQNLRSAGIGVSVDDFGAGDTTVDALRTWPIDEVKIDRSLVRRTDAEADAVIGAVVATAREHGWRVVAEGIETIDDLDRSIRRGCDRGQGFLWGMPVPASDMAAMLG